MITDTNLSVDNKPVKWMTINGRIVYSTDIDHSYPVWALENTTLSAGGIAHPGSYTPPGDVSAYTYMQYNTPRQYLTLANTGASALFPIAPHIWIHAKHYNQTLSSFSGPKGTIEHGQTYTVKEQIALTAWAEQHSLPLPDADISDIEMIESNEACDDDNVPYLMPYKQYQGWFHRDSLKGECGWTVPQDTTVPQPIVFTTDTETKLRWSTPNLLSALVPEGEQYDYIRNLQPTYLGTTGDSGKPIYIQIASHPVIVSHCW